MLLIGLLIVAATAIAAHVQIGDPPSNDRDRCTSPLRHCTDPVVIGVSHHFNGRVEIVAFHSNIGLCIDVDRRESSFEFCGGGIPPSGDAAITFAGYQWGTDRPAYSGALGWVRPNVESVVLRFRRHGQVERSKAMLTQLDGQLLRRIREPEPFGFFEATIRGCAKTERFRVVAYDAVGAVLGRSKPRRLGGGQCDPGTTGIDIGPVTRQTR